MARHESPNHDSPATAQHHSTKPPVPPSGSEPNEKRQPSVWQNPAKRPHGAQPARAGGDREIPASASRGRRWTEADVEEEVEQEEQVPRRPLTSRTRRLLGETTGTLQVVDHATRSTMSAARAWTFIALRCCCRRGRR